MKERLGKSYGFLKTTAIGGLIFLLPVMVIGALLGYAYNIVYGIVEAVYGTLQDKIPVSTNFGLFILFLVTVGILLLLCFFCGLITKRAVARKFSKTVEKQLTMVFPKYAVYKDILAGNIGGDENAPSLTPVSVRFDEYTRLAFESDRLPDERVLIYLPGSPDPWIGTVVIVNDDQVEPLDISFSEAVGIFERLGRDTAQLPIARK